MIYLHVIYMRKEERKLMLLLKGFSMKKVMLLMLLLTFNGQGFAGVGTANFKVVRVLLWGDGSFKIYTDNASVNGLEGCTATDRSLGVPASFVAKNQALSMALAGKTAGVLMKSYVSGCCMTHNGLTSPCVNTLTY